MAQIVLARGDCEGKDWLPAEGSAPDLHIRPEVTDDGQIRTSPQWRR